MNPQVSRQTNTVQQKEGTNMIANIDELTQNEAVAYFKADLCLSDPIITRSTRSGKYASRWNPRAKPSRMP